MVNVDPFGTTAGVLAAVVVEFPVDAVLLELPPPPHAVNMAISPSISIGRKEGRINLP
jgi:hypothetical protein